MNPYQIAFLVGEVSTYLLYRKRFENYSVRMANRACGINKEIESDSSIGV